MYERNNKIVRIQDERVSVRYALPRYSQSQFIHAYMAVMKHTSRILLFIKLHATCRENHGLSTRQVFGKCTL